MSAPPPPAEEDGTLPVLSFCIFASFQSFLMRLFLCRVQASARGKHVCDDAILPSSLSAAQPAGGPISSRALPLPERDSKSPARRERAHREQREERLSSVCLSLHYRFEDQ